MNREFPERQRDFPARAACSDGRQLLTVVAPFFIPCEAPFHRLVTAECQNRFALKVLESYSGHRWSK